ncbi:hypothetical protein SAMN02745898_1135 [Streptomyces sp. 136MFCol5.1]|nr:hypothetical protein SAMN02745898_1135 [Streptomyces sp. 136MFCol5.1]
MSRGRRSRLRICCGSPLPGSWCATSADAGGHAARRADFSGAGVARPHQGWRSCGHRPGRALSPGPHPVGERSGPRGIGGRSGHGHEPAGDRIGAGDASASRPSAVTLTRLMPGPYGSVMTRNPAPTSGARRPSATACLAHPGRGQWRRTPSRSKRSCTAAAAATSSACPADQPSPRACCDCHARSRAPSRNLLATEPTGGSSGAGSGWGSAAGGSGVGGSSRTREP